MATYYWIGGTGSLAVSMSGAIHLSLASGGLPVGGTITWSLANSHNLIVDQNSGASGFHIAVISPALCVGALDGSAAPPMSFTDAGSLYLTGNMTLNSDAVMGVVCTFAGTDQSIMTGGAKFKGTVIVTLSGALALLDDFTGKGFAHKSGVIDTGGHNVTCGSFTPYGSPLSTREVHLGSSTVVLNGIQLVVWDVTGMAALDAANATIRLTGTPTASGIDFKGGAFSYGAVEFQNGSGSVRITGANSYTSLALGGQATYKLVDAQSAAVLGADAGGNRLGIQSATGGTQRILTAQTISVLNNVDFKDIDAAGPAIPWSGTGLGDLGNNANITF